MPKNPNDADQDASGNLAKPPAFHQKQAELDKDQPVFIPGVSHQAIEVELKGGKVVFGSVLALAPMPAAAKDDLDTTALKPAHRAFLDRVQSRPRSKTTDDESKAGLAHFDRLKAELQEKYPGQHVTIDVATGAFAMGPSALEAVYEFESKFGPARTLTFEIR